MCRANTFLCALYRRRYEDSRGLRDLRLALQHGERAAVLGFWTAAQFRAASDYRKLVKPAKPGNPSVCAQYNRWFNSLTEDDGEHALVMASCTTILAIFECVQAMYSSEDGPPKEQLVCSNPGCQMSSWTHSTFKRCAGLCDTMDKPQYCTKECQRADWKRHRSFCRRVPAEGNQLVAGVSRAGPLNNTRTRLDGLGLVLVPVLSRLERW